MKNILPHPCFSFDIDVEIVSFEDPKWEQVMRIWFDHPECARSAVNLPHPRLGGIHGCAGPEIHQTV
ncbi:MAG TPA: hypothetical protein PKX08_12045 [Cyclobacteriaceae bacterium]|nr:hypothetical protein [Cyclobacteriaceae bacterium]